MRILHLALVLVAAAAWCADPDPAAMAATLEKMQPSTQHAQLAAMAGTWDAAVKAWGDPAQPPMESTATATFTVINDGRFVREDLRGGLSPTYTGLLIAGYDRALGKYTLVWSDSMTTSMMCATGTSADDGATITYTATMADCMDARRMMDIRIVVKHVDADHIRFELFAARDGGEAKAVEIDYTRRK